MVERARELTREALKRTTRLKTVKGGDAFVCKVVAEWLARKPCNRHLPPLTSADICNIVREYRPASHNLMEASLQSTCLDRLNASLSAKQYRKRQTCIAKFQNKAIQGICPRTPANVNSAQFLPFNIRDLALAPNKVSLFAVVRIIVNNCDNWGGYSTTDELDLLFAQSADQTSVSPSIGSSESNSSADGNSFSTDNTCTLPTSCAT